MKALFDWACVPLATTSTKGAWLARRRLMAIDATSFDVADTDRTRSRCDVSSPITSKDVALVFPS